MVKKDDGAWPSMRLLCAMVVLAAGLAGCTQPPADEGFEGTCPSWIKYPHNAHIIDGSLLFDNRTTIPDFTRWDFKEADQHGPGVGLGDGYLLEYHAAPLDQVVLDFHMRERSAGQPARLLYVQDAELRVRFHVSDGGNRGDPLEAQDAALGPQSARHEWVFRSDPATKYAILNMTFRVDLAPIDEEPWPRGVLVEWEMVPDLDNDIDTPSVVIIRYAPEYWYRTCGADGTRYGE